MNVAASLIIVVSSYCAIANADNGFLSPKEISSILEDLGRSHEYPQQSAELFAQPGVNNEIMEQQIYPAENSKAATMDQAIAMVLSDASRIAEKLEAIEENHHNMEQNVNTIKETPRDPLSPQIPSGMARSGEKPYQLNGEVVHPSVSELTHGSAAPALRDVGSNGFRLYDSADSNATEDVSIQGLIPTDPPKYIGGLYGRKKDYADKLWQAAVVEAKKALKSNTISPRRLNITFDKKYLNTYWQFVLVHRNDIIPMTNDSTTDPNIEMYGTYWDEYMNYEDPYGPWWGKPTQANVGYYDKAIARRVKEQASTA